MKGYVEILKPISKIHIISENEYFLQLMNYTKKMKNIYIHYV